MKKFLAIVAILSLVFYPITPAFAVNSVWNGGTDNTWADATNWTPAVVPVSGGVTAEFSAAAPGFTTISCNGAATSGILFDTAAAAPYTIGTSGAQVLTLDNGGTITVGAAVVDASDQTVAAEVRLLGAATFANNATDAGAILSFSGKVTGASAAAQTLTLSGSNTGNNNITGVIGDGSGGGTLAINKTGTGTWDLFGNNTYTGGTTVSDGTLIASSSASALGAGTLTMSGGKLQLANNTDLNFGRNTTVTSSSEIDSARFAGGGAGSTQTLGTLSLGAVTLTVGLGDALTTGGTQKLTFGAVTLTGNADINVVSGHAAAAEGLLTLGAVNSSNATDRDFTITGGTEDVTVGVVGNTFDLASLTITGNDITLAGIGGAASGVTGATSVTAADHLADTGSITLTGTTYKTAGTQTYNAGAAGNLITLSGGALTTFTTTADNVTFTGTTTLGNGSNLLVTTAGSAPGSGDITMGTVRGTSVENVTLNAGSANVSVGAIGNASELRTINITGATVTLNGDITTDDDGTFTGDVTVTGNAVLGASITVDTNAVNTSSGGNVNITGATSAGAALRDLTIDTASSNNWGGNVTLGALSNGGGFYVNNLSIITTGTNGLGVGRASGNISLQAVRTVGTQDYDTAGAAGAANGTVTLNGDLTTTDSNITFASNTPITLGAAVTMTTGTGSATLRTVNNAGFLLTMDNTGASASEIAGIVSGNGGLLKKGTGTLTLSAANTYAGTTTINGGTLALTETQTTTNYNFTGDALMTLANTKNITGSVTTGTTNQGTFEVLGTSTVTGNLGTSSALLKKVKIDGGTLSLADTYNLYAKEVDGNAANSGTITFAGASTVNTTDGLGSVNGLAAVNFNGAGKEVSFTGNIKSVATTIRSNVTLGGPTTVTGDLALGGGTGSLTLGTNTLTLVAGGGGSTGAYSQAAGETLNLSIDSAGTFGKIVAAGTANGINGGKVAVAVGTNFIQGGTTFTVIQSGAGAVAAVPTVTSSSSVVTFTAAPSGSNLVLTAVRSNPYSTVSNNPNVDAAGASLEQAGKENPTGDMLNVLNTLDNMGSNADRANAIGTMVPDVSGGSAEGSRALTSQGFTMVSNRLGGARDGDASSGVSSGEMTNGVGVWIQGLGSHIKQDERKGIRATRRTRSGRRSAQTK